MENGFIYVTKYSEKFKKLIVDLAKKAEGCSKIRYKNEGNWRIEYLNNRNFIPKNLR